MESPVTSLLGNVGLSPVGLGETIVADAGGAGWMPFIACMGIAMVARGKKVLIAASELHGHMYADVQSN